MKRIAILGGGISGLTAAYELELARKAGADLDWHLFEASDRLGGIVETTRIGTPAGEYILEGGPDAWVTEKPWARDLAVELGLEADLIPSNDATRKTYIERDGHLLPIPERMRFMVPEDLSVLEGSPLFTASAKQAYADELARAAELKANALPESRDESVASFVRRHFGEEVVSTLAAPLLAGVFGGDVEKLSVRAVMPQMLALERDHGSLIAGLQAKAAQRGDRPKQPIFTSLRRGMASLTEAMIATLPPERLHLRTPAVDIGDQNRWHVVVDEAGSLLAERFDQVVLATSLGATSDLLRLDGERSLLEPLPKEASSAILATFTWPAESAATFTIPQGFGFLVPPTQTLSSRPERSGVERPAAPAEISPGFPTQPVSAEAPDLPPTPLLAATFVDQKFPHRAPPGARILRAFFGGASAAVLASASDETVASAALTQLQQLLGPLPVPEHTVVRRWPRSLPQYEVGHLDRIARLDALVADTPGLHLLGNSYCGVGLPDLIRDARASARRILSTL